MIDSIYVFVIVVVVGIVAVPAMIIGAGYVYGRFTGAGGEVNSLDDAVSKGLERRHDVEDNDE